MTYVLVSMLLVYLDIAVLGSLDRHDTYDV